MVELVPWNTRQGKVKRYQLCCRMGFVIPSSLFCAWAFETPTETFEIRANAQNVSDGFTKPVAHTSYPGPLRYVGNIGIRIRIHAVISIR